MNLRSALASIAGALAVGGCALIAGLPDHYSSGSGADRENGDVACGAGLPVADPNFQRVVAACVLSRGCDYATPSSLSGCIATNALAAYPQLAGALAATTCAQANAVRASGRVTSECDGVAPGQGCAKNTARACYPPGSSSRSWFRECRGREQCVQRKDDVPDCMVVPSCTGPADGGYACDDMGNSYTCIDGVGFGFDCSVIDATCNPASGRCVYNGAPCTSTGSACDDAGLFYCAGDVGYHFDCAAAGGRCETAPTGEASCVSAGCTVNDVRECVESCDGNTAKLCVGGSPFEVDCASYVNAGLLGLCRKYGNGVVACQ